jgi:hypothetical protein
MKTKKSLRDTMAENRKAESAWANAFGTSVRADLAPVPEKRTRAPNKPSEIPSEHEEQKNFVKWFHTQYPKVLIFAVPNAAMRDFKLAAWLTSEGMFKGIPDLHIPAWKTVIEFKRTKGSTISPEQYWCEAHYKSIGWYHFFAYGCEDAKLKILTVPK